MLMDSVLTDFSRHIKSRSHIIYNDFDLNTEQTVYLNIYQNFVLTAMKMHQYVRSGGINHDKNPKFVKGTSLDGKSNIVVNFFRLHLENGSI